ncbi:MAG: hypothetical protein QXY42_04285 [Candidatus Bathyarchaeia archaeon]
MADAKAVLAAYIWLLRLNSCVCRRYLRFDFDQLLLELVCTGLEGCDLGVPLVVPPTLSSSPHL